MSTQAGAWEGLLDPDETIVWQGGPARGVQIEWDSPFTPFFFLFFTGFSVFWMIMASSAPGPFWMFGLLFFGIGAYNLVGIHFWKAHQRRKTFYTLTTKRAFIGRSTGRQRKLDSYPITPETPLTYEEGKLANIWFAEERRRLQNNRSSYAKVGFERLTDGRATLAKFREVQRAVATTGPDTSLTE